MSNQYFKFKQFTIWQPRSEMKVGTDSVLLGAWTLVKDEINILDIGTGTGILALMIAQRSSGFIDAIEIEKETFEQAIINVQNSNWSNRINLINTSFQHFVNETNKKYELIISNPPYFSTGKKSEITARAMARHSDLLPLSDLIKNAKNVLKENGRINLVIPYNLRRDLLIVMSENDLWLSRETVVRPNPKKEPVRLLIELSAVRCSEIQKQEFFIEYDNRGGYSEEFISLTRDYYLYM